MDFGGIRELSVFRIDDEKDLNVGILHVAEYRIFHACIFYFRSFR